MDQVPQGTTLVTLSSHTNSLVLRTVCVSIAGRLPTDAIDVINLPEKRPGMKIVSIGEVLWDVIEQQEYLGGAPFNFAAHLRQLGHTVFFVSGVGRDPRGERILEKMTELGLSTGYVACVENVATGVVEVTLETAGQPHFIIQRPAAYDFATLSEAQLRWLSSQRPDWIYFGTLMQMSPQARALTTALLASTATARRFMT